MLDLCHVLSLLQGIGRGISSGIERSRAGSSKYYTSPEILAGAVGGGKGIKTNF